MIAIYDDAKQLKDLLDLNISDQLPYKLAYAMEHQLEDNLWMEIVDNLAYDLQRAIYDNE